MRLPFGEWLPDQPDLDNPGCSIAENVVPLAGGYGQFLGLNDFSGALNGTGSAIGRGLFVGWANSTGYPYVFAGTNDTLELLDPTDDTWDDVSKSGGYSTAGARWDFTQIGNRVIATTGTAEPQYYDIGTSTLFADLPGSPPQKKAIGNVRNFIVFGEDNEIHWSGYNNSEIWTPSRATQSDTRVIDPSGGPIHRIVSGQTGYIFQQYKVWQMAYIGPPAIFDLTLIERNRGVVGPRALAWNRQDVFYLAHDGFYRLGDTVSIGAERVNQWFFDNVNETYIGYTQCAMDTARSLVYWAFPAGVGTAATKILVYNWAADKWSYANLNTSLIIMESIASERDSIDIPSSQKYVAALSSNDQLAKFDGAALTAEIETKEFGSDRRVSVDVRPLVDGSTSSIEQYARNNQSSAATSIATKTVNTRGVANFREPYRYHRFRVSVSGGFTTASGVDVEPIPGGLR